MAQNPLNWLEKRDSEQFRPAIGTFLRLGDSLRGAADRLRGGKALVSGIRRREFVKLLGGTAAGWPLVARAQQQPVMPVVGFLSLESPGRFTHLVAAFRR